MYSGSAQGVVERVIKVRYYYYYYIHDASVLQTKTKKPVTTPLVALVNTQCRQPVSQFVKKERKKENQDQITESVLRYGLQLGTRNCKILV